VPDPDHEVPVAALEPILASLEDLDRVVAPGVLRPLDGGVDLTELATDVAVDDPEVVQRVASSPASRARGIGGIGQGGPGADEREGAGQDGGTDGGVQLHGHQRARRT
jgi:hypothetical protein